MKPNYGEIEAACAILVAAQKADWGPVQHAGELYDRASYRYYWEILQKAKVSGLEISPEANEAFF
jgi:citrate lyase subunit beta / citryl-CoA lyase